MNSAIEEGLKTYLAAALAVIPEGEEASPFATVDVRTGTSGGTVPTDVQSVICVMELPHDVGNLYDGMEKLTISTPARVGGYTLTHHRALVTAVKVAMAWDIDDEDAATKDAALDAAVYAASKFHTRGFYFKVGSDAQDEVLWQTTFEILRGIQGPYP